MITRGFSPLFSETHHGNIYHENIQNPMGIHQIIIPDLKPTFWSFSSLAAEVQGVQGLRRV